MTRNGTDEREGAGNGTAGRWSSRGRRGFVRTLAAGGALGLAGCSSVLGGSPMGGGQAEDEHDHAGEEGHDEGGGADPGTDVTVRVSQDVGNSVHWIEPGPRRLSRAVFGTPAAGPGTPQFGDDWIAHRIQWLEEHRPDAAGLLAGDDAHPPFPVPVGWPNRLRDTNPDGTRYTRTTEPVPFSDNTVGTDENNRMNGKLDLTYHDRLGFVGAGDATDEFEIDMWIADPDGQEYEFDIKHLEHEDGVHPHGRGVMTGAYMHGATGIGTPLMPTQYAVGAFWAVGDLKISGREQSPQNTDRAFHIMTTQTVRTADDYRLALDEELPLGADGNPDPYLGRSTHTHLFVPPVRHTPDGPRMVPLETAYELPNGELQPYIHFMFDEHQVSIE